jgi:hypothetical protein
MRLVSIVAVLMSGALLAGACASHTRPAGIGGGIALTLTGLLVRHGVDSMGCTSNDGSGCEATADSARGIGTAMAVGGLAILAVSALSSAQEAKPPSPPAWAPMPGWAPAPQQPQPLAPPPQSPQPPALLPPVVVVLPPVVIVLPPAY